MFDKTDAVSFLHEKFSPSLGHGKTYWTFSVQNCCLLTFEQACSVLGGDGKRVLYLQMLADCKNWLVIFFVCLYFVYIASYALRKNKFLTFLIVIQLVYFVSFFHFFQYCFNSTWVCQTTEFSFHRTIFDLCVQAIANFVLGLNG